MMKFKIGDKVKRIMHSHVDGTQVGDIRIIKGFSKSICAACKTTHAILGDDVKYTHCHINLEHVRIRNNKLARKIYPDYEEDGEWLAPKRTM